MSKKRISTDEKSPRPSKSSRTAAEPIAASPMDVDLLEQMVRLMAANDLNTVDIRDGDRRVILKRGAVVAAAPVYMPAPATGTASPAGGSAGGANVSADKSPAPAVGEDATLVPIKSPMVGTFYAAATPEAKPFVSVGTVVDDDTDVCIIEAMKVFNNIKAELRGTVTKVLVTNGTPVEFGQTLFMVKP